MNKQTNCTFLIRAENKVAFTCVLFFLSFWVSAAIAQTFIYPGPAISDHWPLEGSPYIVQGNIEVANLSIDPGVEVLLGGDYSIAIIGILEAAGALGDTITLATTDTVSSWQGMVFDGAMDGSSLSYCAFKDGNHGVMRITNAAPYFDHCLFEDNSNTSHGGALDLQMLTSNKTIAFRDCVFNNNVTHTAHGGAIRADMEVGSLEMFSCVISNNYSNIDSDTYNTVGGGLYIYGTGDCRFVDCSFTGNVNDARCYSWYCSSTGRGGAIWSQDANLVFEMCNFEIPSAIKVVL